MGSFGEDFAQGMALGSNMYSNAQRLKDNEQDRQWKAEDRSREDQDRKDDRAFGNVWGKAMNGDFSPAVAMANMKGSFGEGKFASGYSIDDKGVVFAHVYPGGGDAATAVNSMEKIPMGTVENVQKNIFNQYAPDRIKALVAAKMMDPTAQQQVQGGALDLERKRRELGFLPQKQQLELAQGLAGIDHTRSSTASINQGMEQSALTAPAKARALNAEAALKETEAADPYHGRKPTGRVITNEDGTSVVTYLYPGDPVPQPTAMAGPPGGKSPAASHQQSAPAPGARQAPDGNWYVPDPKRPGKYLRVN